PEELPMPATEPLSHDDLDALIVRLRLGVDASELHGSLCGYLAGGATPQGGNLLAALQLDGEEVAPSPADQAKLVALLKQCRDALADPELGFEPRFPRRLRPRRHRRACAAVGRRAGSAARLRHDRRRVLRLRRRRRGRGRADRGAGIPARGRVAAVHRVRRPRPVRQRSPALNALPDRAGAPAIAGEEFARRRRQLMQMAGEDAVLLVAAAPERLRNADAAWPYRQDSDFHYLAGFPEPDAVLALLPGRL